MHSLREKLEQSSRFLIGTEMVSVRGGMSERSAVKARAFANEGCKVAMLTTAGAVFFTRGERLSSDGAASTRG